MTLGEIELTLKNMDEWVKPKKVRIIFGRIVLRFCGLYRCIIELRSWNILETL